MQRYLIIIQVLLSIHFSFAQNINLANDIPFENISVSNGLSHIGVNNFHQDSEGYIWISTFDGLNRYNSSNFNIYKRDPEIASSLIHDRVHCVLEHSSGRIFVGTEQGLTVFNRHLEQFEKTGFSQIDSRKFFVTHLFEDSKKCLWILTNENKIIILNFEQNTHETISLINQSKSEKILFTDICEDNHGYFWITSTSSIVCYDSLLNLTNFDKHSFIPKNSQLNSIILDSNDVLHVGGQQGLLSFKVNYEKDIELTSPSIQSLKIPIVDMIIDKNKNLWLATMGNGLYKCPLNNGRIKTIKNYRANIYDTKSLKSNFLKCLYQDDSGAIWIGSYEKGLYRYKPQNTTIYTFTQKDGLSEDYITSLLKYDSSRVLCGTRRHRLDVYNSYENKITKPWFKTDILKNATITSMYKDSRGILWICTGAGLYYLLPNQTKLQFADALLKKQNGIRGVTKAAEDDFGYLWVGGISNLFRLEIDANNQISYILTFDNPENDSVFSFNKHVNAVYNDPIDQSMWIGTWYNGLYHLNLSGDEKSIKDFQFKNYTYEPDNKGTLRSNFIASIYRDSRERLWIATEGGGFSELTTEDNNPIFINYLVKDGLSNNVTKDIIEDNHGQLYIPTNIGLNVFYPENEFFTYYYTRDGIESDYFNSSSIKLDDGRLVFGGNEGISVIEPKVKGHNTKNTNLHFGKLTVLNQVIRPQGDNKNKNVLSKSLDYTNKIELTHDQKVFSLELIAIDWAENSNTIKYRLHGYDDQWIVVKNNYHIASYSNVPPGNYLFEFYSIDSNGEWESGKRELKIIINPPSWLTGWAIVIYIIVLTGLLLGAYFYLLKLQQLKNNLRLERIEKERSKELNEAKLKFFANISHEFKTPLTLIDGPLDKLLGLFTQKDHVRHNLLLIGNQVKYLLRLLDQLLEFRKIEGGQLKLNYQQVELVQFIDKIKSSFNLLSVKKSIKFDLTHNQKEIRAWLDPVKIEKVIYNLLSNAFKFTPERGTIKITLEKSDESFMLIKVTDSGIGIKEDELEKIFERFYQGTAVKNNTGAGIGMALSKSLIEAHHGTIKATNCPNGGSEFIISLPLGLKYQSKIDSAEQKEEIELPKYFVESGELNISPETVSPKDNNTQKPVMMVIDDVEEMRNFIKDLFSPEFNVFVYENGKKALDSIREIGPAIIICDVIMPEMDGITFCSNIKSDSTLNHIPIIMLTSKKELEYQIKGYECGADDYISKPFKNKLLESRVKNILTNKKQLKKRYSHNFIEDNLKNNDNNHDEEFLHSAILIIEKNLCNVQFDNNDFSKALFISKSKLYSEIKRITSKTPVELIRDYRINHSVNLLRNKNLTISEIILECGFNSRTYFYRCFKEKFGMTPKDYRKKMELQKM